jgi:hypothetical protein
MDESFIQALVPGPLLECPDRQFLAAQTRDGRRVWARTWKRIRILELPHEHWSLRRRRAHREVPARSPACRLAVSRPRGVGGVDRRSATEAPEAPRHAPDSRHCRDGVWSVARRQGSSRHGQLEPAGRALRSASWAAEGDRPLDAVYSARHAQARQLVERPERRMRNTSGGGSRL